MIFTIIHGVWEDTEAEIFYFLFMRVLEWVALSSASTTILKENFKNLEWEGAGFQVSVEYLNNLRPANDVILMNESTDELQQMILLLHRETQKVGLKMNMKNIKVMINNYLLDHEIK